LHIFWTTQNTLVRRVISRILHIHTHTHTHTHTHRGFDFCKELTRILCIIAAGYEMVKGLLVTTTKKKISRKCYYILHEENLCK
jgi:hypothetical protein